MKASGGEEERRSGEGEGEGWKARVVGPEKPARRASKEEKRTEGVAREASRSEKVEGVDSPSE